MQIKLENIGIIKDSTLALDGLTVIAGKNNSGKTTVGKTLYSLIDAVRNLQQNAKIDRDNYILKQLQNVEQILDNYEYLWNDKDTKQDASAFPTLKLLISGDIDEVPRKNLENIAHNVAEELAGIDIDKLREQIDLERSSIELVNLPVSVTNYIITAVDIFEKQLTMAQSTLSHLFQSLEHDPEYIDYARERINQTLNLEFSHQIQPVQNPGVLSQIDLSDGDFPFIQFVMTDNRIIKNGPVFFDTPFQRVYLIDNPYILDSFQSSGINLRKYSQDSDTFLDPSRIRSHSAALRTALRRQSPVTIFEQTLVDSTLETVKAKINAVLPGAFEFSAKGDYYVEDNAKIKVSNLATGSKMFSIIKILLEKGEIDKSTLLILDEPEAHLHPQWQNAFAEVIVLLVKELGVHVVLTTHSSNFMLALDAYMRKHGINDQTNFYQTMPTSGGFVQYACVNDDMGRIYQDFLQYLSEVKQLRNRYLYGCEEA